MDINGEQRIPAPQATVWAALNDPEALKACIPGCESVDKISDTQFTARVTMAIGPVKAKFSGDVTLSDMDPPNGYTITGKGSGGAAGFGKGSAKVSLTPDGEATVLRYTSNASVGGKLAQIGQRLVDSAAKKMADEFFTNFTAYLTAQGATSPTAATPASTPAAVPSGAPVAPPPTTIENKPKTSPAIWIGVIVVVAAVLIWYLIR